MIGKLLKKLFGSSERNESHLPSNQQDVVEEDGSLSNAFDLDVLELKTFICLESAYRNQQIVLRRSYENDRITLGEVLQTIFKIEKFDIESLAVVYRENNVDTPVEEKIIYNTDEIWNYDLFGLVLRRKSDEGHYTMGMMHENIFFVKTKQRNFIITFISLGGNEKVKYMRVSVLSPDNKELDDCASLKTENLPIVISFILSFSEVQNDICFDSYGKIEQSYKRKHNTNEKLDDIECEYVHGLFEFQGFYYIGYGKWLLDQSRYYDAYVNLERAFNYIMPNLDSADDNIKETFYDICNCIGQCLSKLDRNVEAAYFFKHGAPGVAIEQGNALALSYAKLGNPIAVNEADKWLANIAQKYGNHKNWPEDIKKNRIAIDLLLSKNKQLFEKALSNQVEYDNSVSIEYVLNTFLGVNRKNITPSIFIYDNSNNQFLQRLDDVSIAVNIVLNKESARDKTYILSCSHAYYQVDKDGEDKSILGISAPIIITTHSIDSSHGDSRIRVDIIMCNYQNNDDKRDFVKMNNPRNYSFVLSTISSRETFKADLKDMESPLLQSISLEKSLLFLEAYKLSKWVFDFTQFQLKDQSGLKFEPENEETWNIFFESAYRVGFCLMELGKTHEAAYYLEIASYSNISEHVQEYINCLANSKDPLALDVVEDIIKRSPKPETEEHLKGWNFHMAFLKRRKAYILIDKHKFDEAKQLLTEMLEDPLCKEFAKGELEYIEANLSQQ